MAATPSDPNETPAPADVALDFLRRLNSNGPWLLTAIIPDGAIETVRFGPEDGDECRAWIAERDGRANLYYSPNEPLPGVEKKAAKADIARVHVLHVDLDARPGETTADAIARTRRLLTEALPEGVAPPTAVVFSGGGHQALWRLREPVPIDGDLARAEDVERYNIGLAALLDGDHAHDVSRVLRLPGTLNLPNRNKRAKGREPVRSELAVFDAARVYDLAAFPAAPPARSTAASASSTSLAQPAAVAPRRLGSVDELPPEVSDLCRAAIVHGSDPNNERRWPSRSEALFYVCCELARAEVEDETILGVITDPDFGISASVLEKGAKAGDYARRQIQKARERVASEAPASPSEPSEPAEVDASEPSLVWLAPVDPAALPMRPWLVEGLLMDGQVTLLAARGGGGKSLFTMHVALFCATGGSWAHWSATSPVRVLMLNAEDDLDEQRRRLLSACESMGTESAAVAERIAMLQARSLVLLARDPETGKIQRAPLFKHLMRLLREGEFGLLVVDPLVELHAGLDENSNTDMKDLVLTLRDVARYYGIPVLAVHHTRKGAQAGDQDGARGGSALVNAARIASTLSPMSEEEAARLLPATHKDERWRYLRFAGAKANYAGRGSDRWLRLESVRLRNGPGGTDGDWSPGLVAWAPAAGPESFGTWERREEFLKAIEDGPGEGRRYSAAGTGRREGRADALLEDRFGLSKEQARAMVRRLLEEGWLVERDVDDGAGHTRPRLFTARERGSPEPVDSEPADAELPF